MNDDSEYDIEVDFSGDYKKFIEDEFRSTISSYRARPDNIRENAGQEDAIVQGGYSGKQVQELVQNAADVVREGGSRIHVVCNDSTLYVANDGKPFDSEGIKTLLHSNMSTKRGDQIGRFGLGFKSVLEICRRPEIFSSTIAFGFDSERSTEILSQITPSLSRYPVLRLPFLLDEPTEVAGDAILRELREWASTVVRLPLSRRVPELKNKVRNFRPEFLLFSPAVSNLTLEGRGNDEFKTVWTSDRTNTRTNGVEVVRLSSQQMNLDWVVSSSEHIPSEIAVREAGDLHSRKSMKVSWAHRLDSGNSRDRGEVWSYFGTGTMTTLPGIINAPFKMNDDRVTLLADRYNEEILKLTVPQLVMRALPHLYRESDPGRHLNALPARGREDDAWFREHLIEPVTKIAAAAPIVPNLRGELRRVGELKVRPKDLDDESDVLERWGHAAGQNGIVGWVHEAALSSNFRSSVVDRLLNDSPDPMGTRNRSTISEWVEGLTGGGSSGDFGRAIIFAADFFRRTTDYAYAIRESRIVPMQDDSVAKLTPGIYLPLDATQTDPGIVSSEVLAYDGVVAALKEFGVRALDDSARLASLLSNAVKNPDGPEAALAFWQAAERSPRGEVLEIIEAGDPDRNVPVRTAAGGWKPLNQIWAAGDLLNVNNADDAKIVIDPDLPFAGRGNKKNLGIPTALPDQELTQARNAQMEWRRFIENEARRESIADANSQTLTTVEFDTASVTFTPRLFDLKAASYEARAKATEVLLARTLIRPKLPAIERFSGLGMGVQTRRFEKKVLDPDSVWIREYGVAQTAIGLVPIKNALEPIGEISNDLLPVPLAFERLSALGVLHPITRTSNDDWDRLFELAVRRLPIEKLHELYARAADEGAPKPTELLVKYTRDSTPVPVKRTLCVVAASKETFEYLRDHSSKPMLGSGDFDLDVSMAKKWNLDIIDISFFKSLEVEEVRRNGEVRLVRDEYPLLRRIDRKAGKYSSYELVACRTLTEITRNDFDDGETSETLAFAVSDASPEKKIYFRSTLRERTLLDFILSHSGSKNDVDDVRDRMAQAQKQLQLENLWEKLKRLPSDEERVVELIGEDGLRDLVPNSALELLELEGIPVTTSLLYRLAQNLHGTDLWKAIRNEIPEEGSAREWANSVKESDLSTLGFADDVHPEVVKQKPRTEEVLGPVHLPKLHDYQKATMQSVVKLLSAPAGSNKGIVQLPTGAGKTRVAVESVSTYLGTLAPNDRLIVWIAQSDELCEQAVEAWTSGWSSFGIPGERLTVSRMWGGRAADEVTSGVHVVVSTFQTMSRRASDAKDSAAKARYQWLEDPAVVVIDEAHGAVAPSYTTILKWFKRSTRESGRALLGLSATPFRGRSVEGSKALVNRFNSTLIEPSEYFTASTAHEYLQNIGVLAQVKHVELEGTTLRPLHHRPRPERQNHVAEDSALTPKRQMLEDRIDLESVASDNDRNRRIVQHVTAHSDEIEHAIVFAASVDHAKSLAAVLDAKGIPAAAIHGGTPAQVRRNLVRRFKAGSLRVLTNFDVLSQGFDAPKVDAVYLCRPTFSPNKYLQMIGRGLRGPLNGGSNEVLVVNVRDNIEQFGDSLAYTEFAHLWRGLDE